MRWSDGIKDRLFGLPDIPKSGAKIQPNPSNTPPLLWYTVVAELWYAFTSSEQLIKQEE